MAELACSGKIDLAGILSVPCWPPTAGAQGASEQEHEHYGVFVIKGTRTRGLLK